MPSDLFGEMTSAPVQTQFGWHIIQCTDHKTNEIVPYEAARDSLHRFLLGQKQNRRYVAEAEDLKKQLDESLRETGMGGLAGTKTGVRIRKKFLGK